MRYTSRRLESQCEEALGEGKVLVVLGARQTGKTTLVRHLLEGIAERSKLFLNMDDHFLRDRLVSTEGLLRRTIEDKAGRPIPSMQDRFHLVIDEAQKAPGLFEMVKDLVDSHGAHLAVVLTGSSALGLHDPVAESLAGRARILKLCPFSLHEGFRHVHPDSGTPGDLAPLVSALLAGAFDGRSFKELAARCRWHALEKRAFVRSVLTRPMFPEPCGRDKPEPWIRDYLATYLEKDIQALAAVGNVALFRSCMRQLAGLTGSPMKWETAAQQVGTTSVTLRKYVGLLDQTLNVISLAPFVVNPVARVVRAPKLYFLDQGLMWGLRGYEDRKLLDVTGMLGTYMEAAAITELAKWCALETTSPELRFWSKTAVSEVDLVISNRGFHIPVEIKLSERFDRSWLRGMDTFEADHRRLGIAVPYKVILYLGDPALVAPRTYAIPLWGLA